MKLEDLVAECIEYSILYGIAAYEGVSNVGDINFLYKKSQALLRELKCRGDDGVQELRKMLDHPNDYVRANVAIFLLSVDTDRSKNFGWIIRTGAESLDFQ